MAGVYFISSHILLRNYEDLERKDMARDLKRVSDELEYQLGEMHSNSSDWSNWDDLYKFMQDRSPAFVQSNLADVQLNLDIMMFLDSKGRIYQTKQLPRKGHQRPPQPEDLRSSLGFDRPSDLLPTATKDFSGIVLLKAGDAMLVSVRPIVKTTGLGPPRGWIVFGLRLDDYELGRLAGRSHLNLALYRADSTSLSQSCREAVLGLKKGEGVYTKPLNAKTVSGFMMLRDVFGRPTELLRLTQSRDIYAEGLASQTLLIQFLIVAGVIFSIVILSVLEIAALSRVSRLSVQVERISSDTDELERVVLPGKDELTWLAKKIDGMVQSLRERKLELGRKNQDLEETVNRLAAMNHILEHSVEGIAEFDADGRIVSLNASFAEMHGYDADTLRGFHWQTLVAPEDQETLTDAFTKMTDSGKAQCEVCGRKRDGSLFHEEVVIVGSTDADKRAGGCHWFTKDISERKNLESRIEHQAFHDLLTGLPNRALFVDRLRTACKRAARRSDALAVLFLDLNDFKAINDSMGHEAGDHVLIGVANRIQHCIRQQDTVARLGGDEFTVLLDGVSSLEEAIEVSERITEGLESPISLPNGKVFVGTSIGIVFSKNGQHDADVLLHDADIAMYQAKGTKQPFAVFDPAMNAPALQRKELADALREALTKDELTLDYQPVVDLRSGRAVGIEALLRWRDPVRGDVPPNLFIHVAEEAGFIDSLGTWSLRHACRQMRQWLDALPPESPLTMSVNLSGRQLQRTDLLETVTSALADANLAPERLCLEISAKLLANDMDRTLELLSDLKSTGIRLAIDDFGTGSHLIARLGDSPFDLVKIDGSVTWLLDTDDEARALAQAMVIMAKSGNIDVAAEGIESIDQVEHLQKLGCSYGQGFLFGRPLPASELLEVLVSGSPVQVFRGDISSESAA
jgi:diguanylate cyclase (GGDEF)-like protein/PAS domain S-box-containing protein